ncbi:MAG: hypothetical protein ACYTF6_08350, partial [Planctomycetota bacterium]
GLTAVLSAPAAPGEQNEATTQPAEGAYRHDFAASAYEPRDVQGWTVMVHKRLLEDKKQLGDEFLELLSAKLVELKLVMPPETLKHLRRIKIWADDGSRFEGGCYHWSARWMASKGLNPEKARAIEIGSPANFIRWSRWQPGMIIHELAHGYNDHFLSKKLRAEIAAAYKSAMEKKLYETVLYWHGGKRKAYAARNAKEYFAEMSEAFFGTNDIYPFVRAEIKEYDPTMYKLLQKAWGVKGEPPGKLSRAVKPALAPIEDEPGLPRVLLVGDSISIGYTLPTRELLEGKANVHRIPANAAHTAFGLENLDGWLGEAKWDVIHFNWGLHDMKRLRGGKLDISGKQLVPVEQYEKNLRRLLERLKATGATLIWASTTPVPQGAAGRKPSDPPAYNAVAKRIMEESGVAINDLHAFSLPRLEEMQLPRNVHFKPEGSRLLAEQVAKSVLEALGRSGQ